ncbi:MAG: hypothetical protein ACJAXB_001545, partial [Candidatus Endobugula sp.]
FCGLNKETQWTPQMMKRAGEKKSNNKECQFWEQHNQPIQTLY